VSAGQQRAARRNGLICDKCVEIDRKIWHFKDLVRTILDPQTLDGIAALIAELEAQKADLHPEEKK
jgi:N12 class adenine-specific DNA methylase